MIQCHWMLVDLFSKEGNRSLGHKRNWQLYPNIYFVLLNAWLFLLFIGLCPLQKINEKPQVVNDYERGAAIPNNQILGKLEKQLGKYFAWQIKLLLCNCFCL